MTALPVVYDAFKRMQRASVFVRATDRTKADLIVILNYPIGSLLLALHHLIDQNHHHRHSSRSSHCLRLGKYGPSSNVIAHTPTSALRQGFKSPLRKYFLKTSLEDFSLGTPISV